MIKSFNNYNEIKISNKNFKLDEVFKIHANSKEFKTKHKNLLHQMFR